MDNPCIGCKKSWCAENNLSCHDTCGEYQLWKDCEKLKEYNKKQIAKETKDTLNERFDILREEYIKKNIKNMIIQENELITVYKVFEFIKNKTEGIDANI